MEQFGKFELLTLLAKGGMAEVYLARQQAEGRFERHIVIKRLLPDQSKQLVDLFLQEARVAALLDHPNIVPVYDFGRVDEKYFLAMPYVHGLTLRAVMEETARQKSVLPVPVVCEIVRQALDGLAYAHDRASIEGQPLNIVHRDIGPMNVMVNDDGRVVVLDFGIAAVADSTLPATSSLRGKLPYMSPEHVRGEKLDRRSDIFSIGVLFYEMLTGRRLFRRSSQEEVLRAILDEPLPDPVNARPELPEPIVRIVEGALARDRRERYPTANDMSAEIRSACERLQLRVDASVLKHHVSVELSHLLDQRQMELGDAVRQHSASAETKPKPKPEHHRRKPARRLLFVTIGITLTLFAALGIWRSLRPAPVLDAEPLRLGVTPYLPEQVLRTSLVPLQRYLEQKLQRKTSVTVTDSYEQMLEALLDGKVDFADLPPYLFLIARQRDPQLNVLATARTDNDKQNAYQSYIVVSANSMVDNLADLKGLRICYVDQTSASGYLMPRAMVRKRGFNPDKFFSSIQFSGNHYRALRDLLAQRCDVAAVNSVAYLTATRQKIPVQRIKVLEVSRKLPYGVFCASSKLPRAVVSNLRRALLDFRAKEVLGRPVLSDALRFTSFTAVDIHAFDALAVEAKAISSQKRPAYSDSKPDLSKRVD